MSTASPILPVLRNSASHYVSPLTISGNYSRVINFTAMRSGTLEGLYFHVSSMSPTPLTLTGSVWTAASDGQLGTMITSGVFQLSAPGFINFLPQSFSVTRGGVYYYKIDQATSTGSLSMSSCGATGWSQTEVQRWITVMHVWNGSALVSGSSPYILWCRQVIDGYTYGVTDPNDTITNQQMLGMAYRLPQPVCLIGAWFQDADAAGLRSVPITIRLYELPEDEDAWVPLDVNDYLEQVVTTSAIGQQRAAYETAIHQFFSQPYVLRRFAICMFSPSGSSVVGRIAQRVGHHLDARWKIAPYCRGIAWNGHTWLYPYALSDVSPAVYHSGLHILPYRHNGSVASYSALPIMIRL